MTIKSNVETLRRASPIDNVIYELTADSALPVRRRGPHRDEVGARGIVLVEKSSGDAAGDSVVDGDEAGASDAIPAIQARCPLRVCEGGLASVGRTEGVRSFLQSAQANVFEEREILKSDGLNDDQCNATLGLTCLVYRRAGDSLCLRIGASK